MIRGEIWIADLHPVSGTEPGKIRPVLIWQNPWLLEAGHPSTIILPLTTNVIQNAFPLRVHIEAQKKLKKDSDILIDQIRAIDNKRLVEGPLMLCSADKQKEIELAVMKILGCVLT